MKNHLKVMTLILFLLNIAGCGGAKRSCVCTISCFQSNSSVCGTESWDWDEDDSWVPSIEEGGPDFFYNMMQTSYAVIDNVTFTVPSAGNISEVSANITHNASQDESAVMDVKLVYSVDESDKIAVEMTDYGNDLWRGSIPAHETGEEIRFYIWVMETNGNVTKGGLPSRNSLVYGVNDINDSQDYGDNDLDVLSFASNYDDENLYFKFSVHGEISEGSINPPNLHFYELMLDVGKFWVFVPAIKNDGSLLAGLISAFSQQHCTINDLSQNDIDRILETGALFFNETEILESGSCDHISSDVEAVVNGNVVEGSIKRSIIDMRDSEFIRLELRLIENGSLDQNAPVFNNASNQIFQYFTSYCFVVK